MAGGVVEAIEQLKPTLPIAFTIHGTGEDEAIALVRERLGVRAPRPDGRRRTRAPSRPRRGGPHDRHRRPPGAGAGHDRPAGPVLDRADDRVRHPGRRRRQPRQGRAVGARPAGVRTVAEAAAAHRLDASCLFVPPAGARAAVVEAVEAGVQRIVCLAEHIPSHDVMEMLAVARDHGAQVLGPNTAGLVVPGEASVGIMPGFAANIFQPGSVGRDLAQRQPRHAGLDEPRDRRLRAVGLRRHRRRPDPRHHDRRRRPRRVAAHPGTEAIVIVGEIGGGDGGGGRRGHRRVGLPTAAFIAGRSAPPGRRMGHAGAIVTGGRGSGESKVTALREVGVAVVDIPSEIGPALRSLGAVPHGAGASSDGSAPARHVRDGRRSRPDPPSSMLGAT